MKCLLCKKEKIVSKELGVCKECILENFEKAKKFIFKAHKKARQPFSLFYPPPKTKSAKKCFLCFNECQIKEGETGFCGIRECKNGKISSKVGEDWAVLEFYFDPLPTNCVASFCCQGSKMMGKKNLALFYGACNFDCLFCQNWHYRYLTQKLQPKYHFKEIVDAIDEDTFCICFFGGDPTPQIFHAFKICEEAIKKNIRICWETNGAQKREIIEKMAEFSLKTGGIVKFDLKAFDERLHIALTGVSNKRTFENFEFLAKNYLKKAKKPFLVASTLLVPGYIDEKEVEKIAKFIASLDPEIPYSLLAFYPHFLMKDLPLTSKKLAFLCYEQAKKAGLKNVNLGNLHLLV